ncbi:hypothetical protein [Hansschlegelia sp.]|uniref:hypothetical protein n=1 Tax=Hansschlegelia sp. TaxID=2041892 RepID=UPI002BBF1B61|nr:hypothetical protein [Hansschlegelia sp.]HVI27278.1 hypothetical protein [Hansschlegelia sp.]
MSIDRSLFDAGTDKDGSDASDLAIVCCVTAGGLAASGLLLDPPNLGAACLLAAAASVGLAFWATSGQP